VVVDPSEERRLVNQYAAADAANNRVESVGLRVKDQVTQAAGRRPRMLLGPLADR
jgi:hypothetical protein